MAKSKPFSTYQQHKSSYIFHHGAPAWEKKERERKLRYRKNNPLRVLLIGARKRAKEKNIKFTIDIDNPGIEIPKVCPVLGIRLFSRTGQPGPNSPSLDRIDNAKGYVPGNVIVISHRANAIKRDSTLEELRDIVKFYGRIHRARYKSLPQTHDRIAKGKKGRAR